MQQSLLSFYSANTEAKCTRTSPRKPPQIVIPDDIPDKKKPLKEGVEQNGRKHKPGPKSKTRRSPVKRVPSSDEDSLPDLCIEIENPVAALAAAVDNESPDKATPWDSDKATRWDPFTDQLVADEDSREAQYQPTLEQSSSESEDSRPPTPVLSAEEDLSEFKVSQMTDLAEPKLKIPKKMFSSTYKSTGERSKTPKAISETMKTSAPVIKASAPVIKTSWDDTVPVIMDKIEESPGRIRRLSFNVKSPVRPVKLLQPKSGTDDSTWLSAVNEKPAVDPAWQSPEPPVEPPVEPTTVAEPTLQPSPSPPERTESSSNQKASPRSSPGDGDSMFHPTKRFKSTSGESSSDMDMLPKLVARKLIIPCLQPPSAFNNPPKEIEFYNLRYNIYSSRQKNYALMGKAMNKRKKNNVVYFEVDKIVTHKVNKIRGSDDTVFMFLVKWTGFSDRYNSWENEDQFETCPLLLLQYFGAIGRREGMVQNTLAGRLTVSDEMKAIKKKLRNLDRRITDHNSRQYQWELDVDLSAPLFKAQYKRLLKQYGKKVREELGPSFPSVLVINEVDFNLPPLNFTFVRDRYAGKGVHISDDTLIGCVCGGETGGPGCCQGPDVECCPHLGGAPQAYNNKGRLQVKPGSPIYECNARCSCGPDCGNRVVQRGTQVQTAIVKTIDKGWGLKTMQDIPKGTFVVEYVGEVINFQEAERRGKEYDAQGLTYLFDLDYNSKQNEDEDEDMFTIDAAFYGNTSHFINHSCDPNLAVFTCWINNLDIRLPHICLFAIKSIAAGEELTFNYQIDRIVEEGNRAAQRLSVECRCGSKNCVRYLHG